MRLTPLSPEYRGEGRGLSSRRPAHRGEDRIHLRLLIFLEVLDELIDAERLFVFLQNRVPGGHAEGPVFRRIAQSFNRREPSDDMAQLKHEHPQVVGLGIEDSTALIVHGHVMEVVGENQVAVFESTSRTEPLKPAMLESGDRYNFKDRSRVVAATGRATERGGE